MKRKRLTDRRQYQAATSFPLTNLAGCMIPCNRSSMPDRRLQNLLLHEMDTEEFYLTVIQPSLNPA